MILQKSCQASRSGLGSRVSPSSSEDLCWDYCLRSLPALYTAVDNGCPSCSISPLLHGKTNSLFLPPLLIWDFLREFQLVFWALRYRLTKDHQSNFSPRSKRIPSIFNACSMNILERLLCRTDALYLGLLIEFYFCSEWNGRPSKW